MDEIDNFLSLIKKKRAEFNMTIEDVAIIADCSKSYIWDLENKVIKNPSLKTALTLSVLFNIDLHELDKEK